MSITCPEMCWELNSSLNIELILKWNLRVLFMPFAICKALAREIRGSHKQNPWFLSSAPPPPFFLKITLFLLYLLFYFECYFYSMCFVLLYFVFFFFVFFWDRVSLCSLDYPRTCSVDQAGLKLKRSTCLCLPSAGIKGMHIHCPASFTHASAHTFVCTHTYINIHTHTNTHIYMGNFCALVILFFLLRIFLNDISNAIPKVPHTLPPTSLPTHSHFFGPGVPLYWGI